MSPRIGAAWRLDAYSVHDQWSAVDVVFTFVSPARASIPLPPFGTILFDPIQSAVLPPFVVQQSAGLGLVSFPIPDDIRLVGRPVQAQGLLLRFQCVRAAIRPAIATLLAAAADGAQPAVETACR